MIDFYCQFCGKTYSVGDEFTGRQFRCVDFQTPMVVPAARRSTSQRIVVSFDPTPVATVIPETPRLQTKPPMRLRRLCRSTTRRSSAVKTSTRLPSGPAKNTNRCC